MAKSFKTKTVVLTGLFMAIVFLLTYTTKIYGIMPNGYINLGDTAVIIAGVVLGPMWGFIASAIGSAASDLTAGFVLYAPITFFVKGFEAVIASIIYSTIIKTVINGNYKIGRRTVAHAVASICGGAFMVFGYFLGDWFIMSIFDKTFGYAAAVTDLPGNAIQGIIGAILAIILLQGLSRTKIWKSIL